MNPPPRSPPFLWKNINKRASERHAQSVTRVLDVAIFTTLAPAGRGPRRPARARGAGGRAGAGPGAVAATPRAGPRRRPGGRPPRTVRDAVSGGRSAFLASPKAERDRGVPTRTSLRSGRPRFGQPPAPHGAGVPRPARCAFVHALPTQHWSLPCSHHDWCTGW